MKFAEICAEASKTAHKVYGLGVIVNRMDKNGLITKKRRTIFHRPKQGPNPVQELKQQRDEERRRRANQLAELVHAGTIEKCEELGVDISGLIEPPKHITLADNKLAIRFTGLK